MRSESWFEYILGENLGIDTIQEYGKEGWELVQIIERRTHYATDPIRIFFYFKRQVFDTLASENRI